MVETNVVDRRVLEQALQAKDPRFDGRFFIGVKTTGVYCRPVCPVKSPRLGNVFFFPSAAAASEAGFRPCLRCRPESSPGTPAWAGTSTTVARGLRLIGEGALDNDGVDTLSDRLGVTSRHLSRLFMQHVGASPKAIAQIRRLQFAKQLLDETDLSMTDIAMSSGYGSVRRFNDHFKQVYGRPPSELRRRRAQQTQSGFVIHLPYRPPYAFEAILEFLEARAIPGVERISGGRYGRNILVDGETGAIRVSHEPERRQLACEIDIGNSRSLMNIVERVRRMFDLNADPMEIQCCLSRDRELAPLVDCNPGRRVPGAWDAFEVAVRAIVGQQVSVKGATTVMGRIAEEFGDVVDGRLSFPEPAALAELRPEELPMPQSRARAIKELASGVANDDIDLSVYTSREQLVDELTAIRGIGPWTAQYVAMRAINDPDAFLDSDLVLLKVARQKLGIRSSKELISRAEQWRPWRAYAGMHLWALAGVA